MTPPPPDPIAAETPPSPSVPPAGRHLTIFSIGMVIVSIALVVILFVVEIEASVPASGVIRSRSSTTVTADQPGNWLPSAEVWLPGTTRAGGEIIGQISGRPIPLPMLPTERLWMLVESLPDSGSQLEPMQTIAAMIPVNAGTLDPLDVEVEMEVPEKYAGELELGQGVRFRAVMYPSRIYGFAAGTLRAIEPIVRRPVAGEPFVRAIARVDRSPFPMRLGASIEATIILGKRSTYRVILDH
ncbi:efflux RND transporter periplasmic adaptor subunit [Tuwongella immobilis]|uniref:Uncharacterized protein n=1 Tax=Tuwongella immobilis TaxID=692036 RepID=A0A6C2YPJ2_9BACT|nr:hypothetical protein [Tuwongella immobilis]VIP03277.1 unnamed protein product [Tuwongella immobilis]VTS03918.1 unnamed protein product [Tuwongella immobilis]